MCVLRRQDNQADNLHRPMSSLQPASDQPRNPGSRDIDPIEEQLQGASATPATPQKTASHQSQQSTPGYHTPSHGCGRGAMNLPISNSTNQGTAPGSLRSGADDELRSMEPKQSKTIRRDLGCKPQYQSFASRNCGPVKLQVKCSGEHADPDTDTLTEESLLQSLQSYKMRERGSLTNAFLEIVARSIRPRWRALAARLGFTDNDCDEFESGDNIAGPYWPAFIMLDRWRADLSDTEVRNGKAILADAIQPLDEHLYDRIVNWDR
ncbi:uncharacterized protein [Amphiura filiformis]|uniref:uncharacterized protein n=1 Tax=Amphiura filiformis TaxID=82378 RepID=UPI003B227EAD